MAKVESGGQWNGEITGKPVKPVDEASPNLNLLRFLTPSEAPFSPAIRPFAGSNDRLAPYGNSGGGIDYFLPLPSPFDKQGATVRKPDRSEVRQFRLPGNEHATDPHSDSTGGVDYFLALPSPFDEHDVTVRTARRPDGSQIRQFVLPGNEHAVDETPKP